jgi:hypothetical protein
VDYTYCSSQCPGCRLGIVRNVTTVPFFFNMLELGKSAFNLSRTFSFIGMQKNSSSGTWVWMDGQVCDCNSLTDEVRVNSTAQDL